MTPSQRLARDLVVSLCAAGVRQVVLCPGSRSAPLAYALADADRAADLRLHVRHDERSAAFVALGAAGVGAPAVVVTTSGTAAANLHPAILEAHHAGVPLVAVTADRPRTLRGTWANQTSELQADLFGDAVRARLDLDAGSDADPASWCERLLLAVGRGSGTTGRPGPVHLNLGLVEPLLPPVRGGTPPPAGPQVPGSAGPVADHPVAARPRVRARGPRTVIDAGPVAGDAPAELAAATGWPLLAEPSSGARGQHALAGPYRLLLDRPGFADAVQRVVVHGRPTLSRPVTALLARREVELVLVSPTPDHPDPGRAATRAARVVPGPRPGRDVPDEGADGSEAAWNGRWRRAAAAARTALDDVLDAAGPSGPAVARAVARALGPAQSLVVAASNPVRDLDLTAPALPAGAVVRANRGLSGIDGTVSTAVGHALASGRATRVLVGDLAFLHDLNALLLPPGEPRPRMLQVMVVNDGGGGIFSLLEYGLRATADAAEHRRFERLFGTPHRADVAALCRGHGITHRRVNTTLELDQVLAQPDPGISVVEVPVDRAALRSLHATLTSAVTDAVDPVGWVPPQG